MGEWHSEEIAREGEMAELGSERYWAQVNRANAKGRSSTTPAGRHLLRHSVTQVADAARQWARKVKKQHTAYGPIKQVGYDAAALLACRCVIDSLFRPRSRVSLVMAISGLLEDELAMRTLRKGAPPVYRKLMKRTAHGGHDRRMKLARHAAARFEHSAPRWSRVQRLRVGTVLLEFILLRAGLIEERTTTRGKRARVEIHPTARVKEWFEKSNREHEFLYPIWMPTPQPPRDWEGLWGGGYHTDFVVRKPLVHFQPGSGWKTHPRIQGASWAVPADGVNVLQRTEWAVNDDVLETLAYLWDNGAPVPDLPDREPEPIAARPEPYDKDSDAARAWRIEASKTHERNRRTLHKRMQTSRTLQLARKLRGEGFFFPHFLDFRGRAYPRPALLNPQGDARARSLLRFRKGLPIGEKGAEWLAVHGANTAGVKGTLEQRVGWAWLNDVDIRKIAQDPLEYRGWQGADDPWGFLAFCLEWGGFRDQGTGFLSTLPVMIDGSNNGLQIFALLLRSPVLAEAVNVAPNATPQDIYQRVADGVEGWELPRSAVKRPVMTLPYGAREWSCHEYLREWLETQDPDTAFEKAKELQPLVWAQIEKQCGPAIEAMDWLQGCADVFSEQGKPMTWRAPTGFVALQSYRNWTSQVIRTTIGDNIRWSRLRRDAGSVHARESRQGISPNYVHSLDAACMTLLATRLRDAGITHMASVHDSFGTHAGNMEILAGLVRNVYRDVFATDLLGELHADLQGQTDAALPPPPERGSFNVDDVLDSHYLFS